MTLPHPRDLVGLSRLNQAPPKKNMTQTAFVHAFRGGQNVGSALGFPTTTGRPPKNRRATEFGP